jgi:N-acetylglucosaminyl-diphospho-decaprenol L-rhamnosyltransferase
MMPAEITVVVGNYEGEDLLGDLLGSLDGQTRPAMATIVVDAMSKDRSAALAEGLGARVLIRENRGLGYLYNEGARAATTPYVFLVNNDVALDSRCLELLGAELDRDEHRFAADPRQMSWSGEKLVHARAMLTRGPMLRQPLPGFRLELMVPADDVVPTVSANGGAMLVRRDRMLELGGFDETMFMDFEDIDLCWRAWLQGWESVYVPDAFVRHRVGAVTTAGPVMTRRLISSHHNLMRFALKCFPTTDAARVVSGELLRLPRHPRLIGPALWQVVRSLHDIGRERKQAEPDRAFSEWVLGGLIE